MWLTHPTRTQITPCSQSNHCSWTSRLSPAHRAHHVQTDVLQQLQDSKTAPRLNSQGSQDNISQPPETPETETRSSDTLSLYPTSPLLSFSKKMEELVYAGTKLSHSFAASPKISTKKTAGPPTTKNCRPSSPSSSCESSPTAATTAGPKPSSVICVGSPLYWQ